ncbi:Methyltransferase type 11 [Thermodesulfatator indicus DSM 15286]|uniref:Methyltransferase type 11 n=1 Tax=Thermodesulfatator indicus (strain DSM 15286 / JCM 11887 / CIR29812) TaxID=667014 RepID=F8ADT3_THEID|nr:class I SAM-dependent methyltransferase [Thermodesulfatator indicus]AEH46043.1 Methyltransferase type 11 [Thermodesulfatator indicus DSM 15286]
MWRKISQSFGQVAQEYDQWYEKNPLFCSELEALKLLGKPAYPSLEIGVGTGAFAKALGFNFGLDPSLEMLSKAQEKGIKVVAGLAEALPFKSESIASCGLFFTFCFLAEPEKALRECYRILQPKGKLFLGFVPAESPLGKFYQEKAQAGHPLYKFARFRRGDEVLNLFERHGFSFLKGFSTLFNFPSIKPSHEKPHKGLDNKAGFWAVLFEKR